MKIRTQFIITMLLFGITLVVIATSAIITSQKVEKATRQEAIASNIAQGAGELGYLANDYLIYRESQQLSRWRSRFASFSNSVASLNLDKPEQQALVRNIQANKNRLKEVFDSTASASGDSPRNHQAALDPALFQISWSRMAVQSQGLVSDASRLSQLLHVRMDRLTGTRTWLMYAMVGLLGVFLLGSYLLTYRRILKSLATLQAGTAIIGSGDLDFKIEEKKQDEIGALSKAFNRMTTNLKSVTASKEDLEREISERKRAEEALREAHDRAVWLARFPEQNPNPILRASTDGTILYRNPASTRLPGWRCQVDGLLQEELLPLFSQVVAEEKEFQGDVQIQGKDYFISITPFPEEHYANLYGQDITKRKQAEEALRWSERRYRRFIEVTNQFAWVTDANGLVVEDIPALRGFTEQTYGQAKGSGWSAALHPEDLQRTLEVWNQAVSSKTQYEIEYRMRRYDGVYRLMLARGVPIFNEQGNVLEWVGTCIDITERRKAEEALLKAHRELQEHADKVEAVNKELESFNYTVSHDLRSPLRAIAGFTRMILNEKGATFDPETRRKFGIVEDNAQKMGRLIDDLLRLSRLGRAELNWSKVDMKGLVGEVLQEIRTTEPERKFTAEIGDLPSARGDQTMIRQLLANLISNAVKFTRGKPGERIEVGSFEQSGEQVYYVKDNGVGFDMKYYNKLFGVFQRLVSESQFEGTGVGLAIVQRIAQRHGGRVWAEGKINGGATFYFTIPGRLMI